MDTKLAQALKFTEDDLAANREGHVTQAQMIRLRQSIRREIVFAWAAAISVVTAIILGAVLRVFARGHELSAETPIFITVVFTVTLLILGALSFWRWQALREDLRVGCISVSGQVQLKIRGRKALELTVATQDFRVASQEVFLAFHNDEHYHIYYVPRTKFILSAEPINPSSQIL